MYKRQPILAALTSYLADGKLDKALFIGIGTALGEMLGTAIPIPVVGTLLGGAIGFYIGDLLYTLFRGGGIGAVLNKLKEDLKKVFNVGKAVGKWAGTGFARFYEGIPKIKIPDFPKDPPKWIPGWVPRKKALWNIAKVGMKAMIGPLSLLMGKSIPILPWLLNPLNTTPLLIKAFFSRKPMKEDKKGGGAAPMPKSSIWATNDKKDDEKKNDTKKLDKIFKMSGKEYDLSQSQGGLSREEYDALGNSERNRLDRRIRMYASQNNIVPTNNNGKKISSVEAYASYENGGEEVIVIPPQENTGTTSQPEKGTVYPVMVGSGSGGNDEISARLYERG